MLEQWAAELAAFSVIGALIWGISFIFSGRKKMDVVEGAQSSRPVEAGERSVAPVSSSNEGAGMSLNLQGEIGNASTVELIDDLERLSALVREGHLTQAEFNAVKSHLLKDVVRDGDCRTEKVNSEYESSEAVAMEGEEGSDERAVKTRGKRFDLLTEIGAAALLKELERSRWSQPTTDQGLMRVGEQVNWCGVSMNSQTRIASGEFNWAWFVDNASSIERQQVLFQILTGKTDLQASFEQPNT